MAASNELRLRVTSVVDYRLMDAAKCRTGIRAQILKPQRLKYVDHKVGAWAFGGLDFNVGGGRGFLGGYRTRSYGRNRGCARKKTAAWDKRFRRLGHLVIVA
jgi:hypothetical protein